jgi:predicted nucleic acid-binding protein
MHKNRSGLAVLELLTFDSEAIIAFFLAEPGGDKVRDLLKKVQRGDAGGYMNIINLTEVYYALLRINPKIAEEKQRHLRLYGLKIIPIDDNGLWREVAKIKSAHTISLADAFAIATAKNFKTKLVAGRDQDFNKLGVELLRIH